MNQLVNVLIHAARDKDEHFFGWNLFNFLCICILFNVCTFYTMLYTYLVKTLYRINYNNNTEHTSL